MEHRNMPKASTRGYTKRQMGQTSLENERKHTRNQATRMEIHTYRGKRNSNAHKSVGKTKRKGQTKYKEKEDEERRLSRESNRQQAEKDQKEDHDNAGQDKMIKKKKDLNAKEKEDTSPQDKKGSPTTRIGKAKKHIWEHLNTALERDRRSAYADAGKAETRQKVPTGTSSKKETRKPKDKEKI